MQETINTRNPHAVEAEVRRIHKELFPHDSPEFVTIVFGWAVSWFSGEYRDYQAIDALYHDLEHTLRGVLCMARLLQGRRAHSLQPQLTQRCFELGILAMLLHDTGFLKKRGDDSGTGAKYALVHVERSIQFAGELMADFPAEETLAVQNMIRCTGVNVKLGSIGFQDEMERAAGYTLGTADLLGQMAASDYIDKLPILYRELAEGAGQLAAAKMKAGGFFSSAEDLMSKTPLFWDNYASRKLDREFQGLYRVLNQPYPDGPNPYIRSIEANIARLRREFPGR